jgi:hypothetical protein
MAQVTASRTLENSPKDAVAGGIRFAPVMRDD